MSFSDTQDHMNKAIQLVEQFLPLNKWNFKQSSQFFIDRIYPVVIYNSENCRIKTWYEAPYRRADHIMKIFYGRLEVPDNAESIRWKIRDNYHIYWHNVYFPLQFLDGLSPREAVDEKDPRFIKEFEQSEIAKEIKYEPEKILVLHKAIWEVYGQRLFDLFDYRNSSLWERYSKFITDFWGTLSNPRP